MPKINNILLIDDDGEFRQLLSVRITKLFPEVVVDEYDILAKGEFPPESDCEKYDILFLDHDLRGEDSGITWFKSSHKRENFPATIMITSFGNKTTAMHALNSGVHYYMTKQNLTEETLEAAINSALTTREDRSRVSLACQ
jgi:DNA-binding response OmpR family regulator